MWRDYYHLAKPGIIRGNLITATAGSLVAVRDSLDVSVLAATLVGLAMVIASACITNNYMDRTLDARMQRTKQRALVTGAISGRSALVLAAILGLCGFAVLATGTTVLAAAIAAVGWLAYVMVYGYAKRHTAWGTVIGSISGAVPPVVGYTAVANQLDVTAGLLFALLVVWQMPHFYAISLFRLRDYRAAGLPVLPLVRGGRATRWRIMAYVAAFVVVAPLLSLSGAAGPAYALGVIVLGLWWLWRGYAGWHRLTDTAWGKRMFLASLVVLSTSCAILALETFVR